VENVSVPDARLEVVFAECRWQKSTGTGQQRHLISVGVYSELDIKAAQRARCMRIAFALVEQSKANSLECKQSPSWSYAFPARLNQRSGITPTSRSRSAKIKPSYPL